MSFLNLRKTKKEAPEPVRKLVSKETAPKKLAVAPLKTEAATGAYNPEVLRRPRITERASASAERGVYVFDVARTANKREIAQAVRLFYKVNPIKVTVATIPAKRIIVKGRPGFRKGGKKAYVYLKEGEKIEVV